MSSVSIYFSASAFLVAGVSCSATPSHSERASSYQERLLSQPVPTWVHEAEQQTVKYMQPRCDALAPLVDEWESSEEYRVCRLRAYIADRSAWQSVVADALNGCKQSGLECCFRQISDNEDHNAQWRRECNIQCESLIGRPIAPARACSPRTIESPRVESRLDSVESRRIVALCQADLSKESECTSLKTLPERDKCHVDCERPHEEKYYAAQVDACVVETLATRRDPQCSLEREMQLTRLTANDCIVDCGRKVRAKLLAAPASGASP